MEIEIDITNFEDKFVRQVWISHSCTQNLTRSSKNYIFLRITWPSPAEQQGWMITKICKMFTNNNKTFIQYRCDKNLKVFFCFFVSEIEMKERLNKKYFWTNDVFPLHTIVVVIIIFEVGKKIVYNWKQEWFESDFGTCPVFI